MSAASVQKHPFTRRQASLSEIEAKMRNLCYSLVALPVVKKNFLSFDAIFQDSIVDAQNKGLGCDEPQPCVVLMAAFEFSQDAAVKKLITDADDFDFRSASIVFSADVVTRIGVPRSEYGSTSTERKLWVGLFKGPGPAVPPHVTQFQENASATFDKYVTLPWMLNDSIAAIAQATGYAKAEPVVMVMFEFENWDRGIEILEDAGAIDISKKATQCFGFYMDANCFGADVVKMI
ncbi:hypothetical protein C8R45DRAFT_933070 [Mycena sanguinolenta]|nr:hypothetical protein C8R45DRAFT_933070 [Mycena sanguinolenta]